MKLLWINVPSITVGQPFIRSFEFDRCIKEEIGNESLPYPFIHFKKRYDLVREVLYNILIHSSLF
jgi:hypothetical protein